MGEDNELFYENIKKKSAKNLKKYIKIYEKAFEIKKLSEGFYQQIESLKGTLKESASLDEKVQSFDYRRMESSHYVDNFFDAGKPNARAQRFKNEIENFRAHVSSFYSNSNETDKKDS